MTSVARVNLKAIAQAAGVSVSTASRVLSGSDYPVNDALRERVEVAARQLDYVPNAQAQGLLQGNPTAIGVLADDLADPHVADVLTGIHRAARTLRCTVTVATAPSGSAEEITALSQLRAHHVGTMVLLQRDRRGTEQADRMNAAVASLLTDDQQVVVLSTTSTTPNLPTAAVNEVLTGRLVADHLWQLGHRTVGVLVDDRHRVECTERLRGLTQVFGDAVAPVDTDGTRTQVDRAIGALLAEDHVPTAVAAMSDDLALAAVAALRRRTIAVPQGMSVVGCHDRPWAQDTNPGLTTVHLPLIELGELAVRMGLTARDGRVDRRLVPPRMVIRGSTGRAPATR